VLNSKGNSYIKVITFITLLAGIYFVFNRTRTIHCFGHIVNGYDETKPGYKEYRKRDIQIQLCKWWQTDRFCDSIVIDGVMSNAYTGFHHGRAQLNFFRSPDGDDLMGGHINFVTGKITFQVEKGDINLNANEAQRWYVGRCLLD
jgi:hypothetical protein